MKEKNDVLETEYVKTMLKYHPKSAVAQMAKEIKRLREQDKQEWSRLDVMKAIASMD